MFKINAPSKEVAMGLARTEDQYRQQPQSNPITGGEMTPQQQGALESLPPAPTEPIQTPTANRLAAMQGAPQPPPQAGLGRRLEFIKAGLGAVPQHAMSHPAVQPTMQTVGALGMLGATGGLGAIPAGAAALGRIGLAGGGGAALGSLLTSEVADTSPGDAYKQAGEAAAFEAMAGPVGMALGAGAKTGARMMAKLDTQLATLAEQYGIRLGVEDLSMRGFLTKTRKVLGRFPGQTSPYQEADARKMADLQSAINSQLDAVAPTRVDPFQVSTRTLRESTEAWKSYREQVNSLYEAWRTNAKSSNATFSPNITRQRAEELIAESGERAAEFAKVDPITGERLVTTGKLTPDPLVRVARKVSELGDGQSIAVYDGLRKDLQGMQAKLKSPHDRARLDALLEGLELDIRSTISSGDAARELQKADRYYKKGKALFETATAQRTGRYRSGLFEVGERESANTRDVGELINGAFNTGNRRAINEYRALVGDLTFKQATRLRLQDAFSKGFSVVDTGKGSKVHINMEALSSELGLFDPGSEKRAALKAMLKGTSVEVRDIENLVRLAGQVAKQGPVEASELIARRAGLGGFESAARTFVPGASPSGAGIGLSALKALTVLVEGRRLGRWLTDPRVVKDLTKAMNFNLPETVRTAAFIRFGRAIEQDSQGDFDTAQSGLAGGLAGGATAGMSPALAPLRALTGAGQAMMGSELSRKAGGR